MTTVNIKYAYRYSGVARSNTSDYVLENQWLDPIPTNTQFDVVMDTKIETTEHGVPTEDFEMGGQTYTTKYEYVGSFTGEVIHRINNHHSFK